MPSTTPPQRKMRCANCKSTEFVQHEYLEVRTPVAIVRRKGQTIVTPLRGSRDVGDPRILNVRCAECSTPLHNGQGQAIAAETFSQAASYENALLAMHFYLFPELYPPDRRAEHPASPIGGPDAPFEWCSDTVENLAGFVVNGLLGHSAVPTHAAERTHQ